MIQFQKTVGCFMLPANIWRDYRDLLRVSDPRLLNGMFLPSRIMGGEIREVAGNVINDYLVNEKQLDKSNVLIQVSLTLLNSGITGHWYELKCPYKLGLLQALGSSYNNNEAWYIRPDCLVIVECSPPGSI